MAVALATLPLNRELAGAGDVFLAGATGAGRAATFAVTLDVGLADFAAGFVAGLLTGFAPRPEALLTGAAFLATGVFFTSVASGLPFALIAPVSGFLPPGAAFPTATFFTAAFFTGGFFTATFLATAFFTTGFFMATFTTAFFTGVFFTAAFFATVFLTTGLLTVGDLATGFFATALLVFTTFFGGNLVADFTTTTLVAGFLAAVDLVATFLLALLLATLRPDFAGVLLAFFTVRPLPPAVVDFPALPELAPTEALALCALTGVEPYVVLAISLTAFGRGGPVL